MIHVLWTTYLVHRHIGTHWHALVNLTVPSRWKGIGSLLTLAISTTRYITMAMCSAVRTICWLIARLHHWWQLKLLVIEIVRFFPSVSFSVARNFLLQINS